MTKYQINNGKYTPEEIITINYRMNLDINFYNNYREYMGDIVIAEWCYNFVINKYPDHAMAYWCLGRLLEKKGIKNIASINYNKAYEICKIDKSWQEHFIYFNILSDKGVVYEMPIM